ncbi:MAG TPA: hypothetical protein VF957_14870 [Bradyrhizobium sp.]
MSHDAASFVGSIPQYYDEGLGPIIFVDYAAEIAKRVAAGNPTRVLRRRPAPESSRESFAMHCPPAQS